MRHKPTPYRPASNSHSAIIPDRISNSEQGISNRRSKPKFGTRHSTFSTFYRISNSEQGISNRRSKPKLGTRHSAFSTFYRIANSEQGISNRRSKPKFGTRHSAFSTFYRISNSEQGISNRRSKPKFGTRHSTFSILSAFGILIAVLFSSCNPFAPALEEGDPFGNLLGDQATVDGFFTNFQTAYELRDMSLYEPLLDSSFIFTYNDFDVQVERQWGFAQEIESTRRLFQNASQIRLQWNQIISQNQFNENLSARIVRSFSLNISLESGDGFRGDGNVNFVLTRKAEGEPWKLFRWRDESEF